MLSHRAARLAPSTTAALDAQAKQLAEDGVDVINLTGGEVDFPTPSEACEGGVGAIRRGFTRYTPVAGVTPLRQAVAARLSHAWNAPYTSEEIIITSGAKQALANTFAVLLDPGDEVILQSPYWVSFPPMIELAGGTPVVIDARFKMTADAVRARITPRTKALLINSPSNPTGVVYDRAELTGLAKVAVEAGLIIVSDEIYGDLVYDGAEFTSVASLGEDIRARTVTIGGLSKTFAMTGWRVGFAAGPRPLISAMSALQGHTTSAASSISQHAALAVLRDEPVAELVRRRSALAERRDILCEGLSGLPGIDIAVEPHGAFFVFADVSGTYRPGISSAADFAERLLREAQVAVVPGADFGCPDHVRMSFVAAPELLRRALARIRDFLNDRRDTPMSVVTTYSVEGMTCGGCAKRVRSALGTAIPEAEVLEIDPKAGRVQISSASPLSPEVVQAAVEESGYTYAGVLS
ncbi:aminotransferase class I/II-fold pyridoxal phosphate-dependent enzyme [Herbidospora cretacea]|uniref:aminotransferase class I/II-fold pyridoxal phosphate-dependent enzyme n=1 Tax=Herbidospora cretacea TaxID=28444 RepID=UPI000A7C0034|nr:aminotransferase class I/II-fold pyridoxal phosphate-dependent enzyme [Herbidospora cretacea]